MQRELQAQTCALAQFELTYYNLSCAGCMQVHSGFKNRALTCLAPIADAYRSKMAQLAVKRDVPLILTGICAFLHGPPDTC